MISRLPSILLQAATVTDTVDLEEQVEKTLTATEKLLEAATEIGFVLLKVVATFVICWFLIRFINHLMRKFFAAQTKKQRLAMTQRKACLLYTSDAADEL